MGSTMIAAGPKEREFFGIVDALEARGVKRAQAMRQVIAENGALHAEYLQEYNKARGFHSSLEVQKSGVFAEVEANAARLGVAKFERLVAEAQACVRRDRRAAVAHVCKTNPEAQRAYNTGYSYLVNHGLRP